MMNDLSSPSPLTCSAHPTASDDDTPVEVSAWTSRLKDHAEIAFQPIVNIHTGTCYGVEALLRGHDRLGFPSIHALFDDACERQVLHQTEILLKEMAIEKFSKLDLGHQARLFLNMDNRVLMSPDYRRGCLRSILDLFGLPPHTLCLEISERHEVQNDEATGTVLDAYRAQNFRLAIDDFGTGYAGLKLLFDRNPDFVKIDRYFISGIPYDGKKKLFVSNIVSLAHVLGIRVVAEGVETPQEFLTCKEIGCDYVQGYLVQKPTIVLEDIESKYDHIAHLSLSDRRGKTPDGDIVKQQIIALEPMQINTPMSDVFETFRRDKDAGFFPVTDNNGEPLGLIREKSLKDLIYSPFGKDLIINKAHGRGLKDFITPCPVADMQTETVKLLETYALNDSLEGILITQNNRYVGFLSAAALLHAVNEVNLAAARDQNPLSKLPGNSLISDYVRRLLGRTDTPHTLVYFDFNNFKPFNDQYGYRQGDRAILLFTELLRKVMKEDTAFIGHVGGDDFFIGLEGIDPAHAEARVRVLCGTFAEEAESFYDADARKVGGIVGVDRQGQERLFPMLGVAAAIMHLPIAVARPSFDKLTTLFAHLKKDAKADWTEVAISFPCELAVDRTAA